MSKKEKKMNNALTDNVVLEIPEDEIYTYHIDGLAAPHIRSTYKNYKLKKIIFALVIIVAVSLSMFFSLNVLSTETFTFTETSEGSYEFTKFSNPGYIRELTINWVLDLEHPETAVNNGSSEIILTDAPDELPQVPVKTKDELISYQKYLLKQQQLQEIENAKRTPNYEIVEDKSKPVTSIKEFAVIDDGYIRTIYIGENVLEIDSKAFYSCWSLQRIIVDENNPNYCDIDGVLYTKDKKTVVCYPCDRDAYLREKYGYPQEMWQWAPTDSTNNLIISQEDFDPIFEEYRTKIMTYVLPSTVETVGEFCFNYSNLATVYLPEGLTKVDSLGFFEMPNLKDIYTYIKGRMVEDTSYEAAEGLETYLSLPEGLTYIGSDAFSFNGALGYIYVPSTVTFIGHHAFWESIYFAENGAEEGLNIALSEEEFKEKVETGDQWVPIHDFNLLRKIQVNYSAQRKTA